MRRPIKKAVVTGAAGFIGRTLLRRLLEAKAAVVSVDRSPDPNSLCRSLKRDVASRGALDDLLDPETVLFHLAARASVADSVGDPSGDYTNNLYGLLETLESARKAGCRMIFPSTASIFDSSNELPVSERAYARPTSPYAAGKLAGEGYCTAYHRSFGLDVRVARMFSVYGVGMNRFAVHDLIRKIQKNREEIEILGDGEQIRDYLYVDDAALGMMLIASDGAPGEDYNLASGERTTLLELAGLIAQLMGCPDIRLKPTGRSFPGDVPKWYADIGKIRGIGFAPGIPLVAGLRRTIDWLATVPPR